MECNKDQIKMLCGYLMYLFCCYGISFMEHNKGQKTFWYGESIVHLTRKHEVKGKVPLETNK